MTSRSRAQKNKESWKWSFSREGDVGNFSLLLLTNEGNGNQKPLYMSLIVYPNPTLRHSALSIVFTLYCTLLSPWQKEIHVNPLSPTLASQTVPFIPTFMVSSLYCVSFFPSFTLIFSMSFLFHVLYSCLLLLKKLHSQNEKSTGFF